MLEVIQILGHHPKSRSVQLGLEGELSNTGVCVD